MMEQAARQLVEAKLKQIADSDEKRLSAADEARERGELHLAATLYLRLASSRRDNEHVQAAKQRFIDLRAEGLSKLEEIDSLLATRNDQSASQAGDEPRSDHYSETIRTAFEQYQELARQYGAVPGIGSKIRSQVARQRRTPEFAAVLLEPEARELLTVGLNSERDAQLCCAYLAYEEAAKLKHAPSAALAADRLAALQRDPSVAEQAKICQQLQWCHKSYSQAQKLPLLQARSLYRQITKRAPPDSQVYRAALAKLQ